MLICFDLIHIHQEVTIKHLGGWQHGNRSNRYIKHLQTEYDIFNWNRDIWHI
jgi:hypothetical protein